MAKENKLEEKNDEIVDRLVGINRVAKVIKGGRRFGFAALVVAGDEKGRVGFGTGKAREVPDAIRKAKQQATKSMVKVALREGRTLHHDITGAYGAGRVIMRSAPPGTGIIAGGPLRAIFEVLGVQDVVAKSVGSQNNYNMVKAAFNALTSTESPRQVAARRGLKVADVLGQNKTQSETAKKKAPKKSKAAEPPKKEEAKKAESQKAEKKKQPAAKKPAAKKKTTTKAKKDTKAKK